MNMTDTFKPEHNSYFNWGYLANVCCAERKITPKGSKYPKVSQEGWLLGWDTAEETGFEKHIVIKKLIQEEKMETILKIIENTIYFNIHKKDKEDNLKNFWN